MNIWQERGCLMHFARLDNTLLKDEESTFYLPNNTAVCTSTLIQLRRS